MAQLFLSDVIAKYIERSRLSYRQIARKAGVPYTTISSWVNGASRQPRNWGDLVRVAQALELTEAETNELLSAAGHATVAQLSEAAQSKDDAELLSFWQEQEETINQIPAAGYKEFIGRKAELDDITHALFQTPGKRLCTLVGMGGVGKSALAQYAATQLRFRFSDGVLWARVRGEDSLMEILRTFAEAFGRDVSPYNDLDSRSRIVREVLANKDALVVLDNVTSTKELKALQPAPGPCALLITTRNRRLANQLGGAVVPVQPFAQADSLSVLRSMVGHGRIGAELDGAHQIIDMVGGAAAGAANLRRIAC